jgi:hypothetical protein
MTVNISLFAGAGAQFFDNNGIPLAGGKIQSYVAGTSTPLATYTSNTGSIAHSNPIILDSAGRVPNEIWLTSGSTYKFVLSTSTNSVIGTYDNITGANDIVYINDSANISFIQAGTGAVATTAQLKMREWVSPHDFGAVGNANAAGTVGTNDNAAFVLLEAAFTGVAVNLQAKIYLVNSPIPHANQYFNGSFVVAAATTDDQPVIAGFGRDTLKSNTFIPRQFPSSTLTWAAGNYNTAFGADTMVNNTTGRRNTAIGANCFNQNSSGFYNTIVGAWAAYSNTIGDYNTVVGNQSLQYNTIGNNNTVLGEGSLVTSVSGSNNVIVGDTAAVSLASGNRNVAVGSEALKNTTAAISDTISIGYQSLSAALTGTLNLAIGNYVLGSNTSGSNNIGIGHQALAANSTAANNTAIGVQAMVGNTTGYDNVAVGKLSLADNLTGAQNTAVGVLALKTSTGDNNTAFGRVALTSTTSSNNTSVGGESLTQLTTGANNTAIGFRAGYSNTTYDNTTSVGYTADSVSGSNQVQLGNASTTTYAYGAVQNRSDARDKADVRPTVLGLDFINSLRPVDFKWDMREDYRSEPPLPPSENASDEEIEAYKVTLGAWTQNNQLSNLNSDGSKKRNRYHHGLIAQEVKAAITASGIDFGGFQDHSIKGGQDVMSIGYEELIAPLIKAVQQLSAEVAELKAK